MSEAKQDWERATETDETVDAAVAGHDRAAETTAARRTVSIRRSDLLGPFVCPPEMGGQNVRRSYAATEDYIIECVDGEMRAYRWGSDEFAPQNFAPTLGREVGAVAIREDL